MSQQPTRGINMMNQKTAVYNAISEVKTFEDGTKVELTKDEKSTIRDILVAGFERDEIELKRKQDDLPKYVNGLLNNWMRKDKRLNGNVQHVIKNKGSRSKDELIKNLRLLKDKTESPEDIIKIDEAIKARFAEIRPSKPTQEVDMSVIPTDLLESLNIK